jgi:hypothetical protein
MLNDFAKPVFATCSGLSWPAAHIHSNHQSTIPSIQPSMNPPTQPSRPARASTSKIARLPHSLREQLNRRLHDGEPAAPILEWLNALPEVQAILADSFEGRPINPTNLTEWRRWLPRLAGPSPDPRFPHQPHRRGLPGRQAPHPTLHGKTPPLVLPPTRRRHPLPCPPGRPV